MATSWDISCDDPAIIDFCLMSNSVDHDDPAIIAFSRMWNGVDENDMNLLLLQQIEPLVFCEYCGQYPANFKCYDCYKTNYCCIECWDCDSQDHAADCAFLQIPRGDLACQG